MIATTPVTITFNKPVAAQTLTGSSFTLSTSTGNPVLGNITVLAGNRVAVFTPAATLAGSTTYKVALNQSVRDVYGHALGAEFNSTFTTAAVVAVGNRLRPEQISIGYPDADGLATISIPANSVPGGSNILVVNMTNGSTVSTVAGTSALVLHIPAHVGDEIVVTIRQSDGTEYTVSQSAYRRADGFVSVGTNGGVVSSEDGTILMSIPRGAINGQANIKLTPRGEDSITIPRTGDMDPSNVRFGAGVEIRSDGDFTQVAEAHLELAAPAGAQEGQRVSFMKPTHLRIDGQEGDVWESVTSGRVEGGKFKTSSPPFFGSFFASGTIIEIFAMMPTFARVVFGFVKELEYDRPNPPVPGVIVLVGDFNSNYFGHVIGRTGPVGRYALFDFHASTENSVPVKAIDPPTGRTAVGTGTNSGTFEEDFFQGLSGYQALNANMLLPHRSAIGGGEAPPTLVVYGRSTGGPPEQDSLFSRGVVTVGQQVVLIAQSSRALTQISGTALVGGTETRQLTWREDTSVQSSSHYYLADLNVSAEGAYNIKVTASTQANNPGSTTNATYTFVGLRNPNTRPPLPGAPSVIHISPADSAENVDLATDIRIDFSEPVHNLVPGQTVYVQPEGSSEQSAARSIRRRDR